MIVLYEALVDHLLDSVLIYDFLEDMSSFGVNDLDHLPFIIASVLFEEFLQIEIVRLVVLLVRCLLS